ncbi:MAG: 2-C-methyl-D-erythritol 4-phosphate cytidylyltransferase [Cyclobacteriaceae bacterium]|nr:2-C-methyl-D-erythritol 4-phosphate cytidylyltransferase [Cyclobacteriaceae bacterium]
MKRYAIIVAGGSGSRMRSDTPKQFMLLGDKPILMHTIQAFADFSEELKIILVLPKDSMDTWSSLCKKYDFKKNIIMVDGGESRYHSVKNGLSSIDDLDGYVAIHDGVRPLVSTRIIGDSFSFAEIHGAAIASTILKESLRRMDVDRTYSVNRSEYRLIQTPQTFNVKLIKESYENVEFHPDLTDDASVVERNGHMVHLFDGDFTNIKITTPEDLHFAQAILKNNKGGMS